LVTTVLAVCLGFVVLAGAVSLGPVGWVIGAALMGRLHGATGLAEKSDAGTGVPVLAGVLGGGLLYFVLAILQAALLGDASNGERRWHVT
jgi:hypothetical protein